MKRNYIYMVDEIVFIFNLDKNLKCFQRIWTAKWYIADS